MTLPRAYAVVGGPAGRATAPEPGPDPEGRPGPGRAPGPGPVHPPIAPALAGDPGIAGRPERPWDRPERVWEQRRALGRRLAALRSRAGFSQWEFAPLTGYSRSTLSDAELGRHRLRREFWQRCDEALSADGVLVTAYDQIEAAAAVIRRKARMQAQAAREEQASRRLQALLPVSAEPTGPGPSVVAPVDRAAAERPGAGGGDAHGTPLATVERCPHCHQPVTIVILAGSPPVTDP